MRAQQSALLCVAAGVLGCAGLSTRAAAPVIALERHDDRVDILVDRRPLTTFHFHSQWDKPFLHPIRTASGRVLSRGWPVEPRDGDEPDHAWHRGLWYGHGDINGEDFWREKPDRSTARLILEGEPKISGGDTGLLETSLRMIGAKGGRIGRIDQRHEFRREGDQVWIHTTLRLVADQGSALRFGDTDDGGFGFRLATEFRQDRGAELINSNGLIGTENIWGRPAKWVKYTASLNNQRAGLVMMDHPSNLRHPTGWHARGYGLCAANPFAAGSFAKNKKEDGSYTLPAGQTLQLRYLIVIFDGDLSSAATNKIFARFAEQR